MRVLAILFVLVGLSGRARAELWASSLGELMKDARSIEIVDVAALRNGTLFGTLVEGVRSTRAPNTKVELAMGRLGRDLKAADRVLVICDSECPRAIGVEQHGWFRLEAQEPMDGAFVYPDLVSHVSLPVLAAGKPVPPLCVKGSVSFVDDKTPRAIEAMVSALDGTGTGTVAGTAIKARFGGWRSGIGAAVGVNLHVDGTGGNGIDLGTPAIAPVAGTGCLGGAFRPVDDSPRTLRDATRLLTGKLAREVFARGTVGKHALELGIEGHDIILVSDLATEHLAQQNTEPGRIILGFPVKSGDTYPMLLVEIPVGTGSIIGAFSAKQALDVRVSTRRNEEVPATPIGVAHLRYVPAP